MITQEAEVRANNDPSGSCQPHGDEGEGGDRRGREPEQEMKMKVKTAVVGVNVICYYY